MYLKNKKLIIIPTRKCGGTSIAAALKEYLPIPYFEMFNMGAMSGYYSDVPDGTKYGVWSDDIMNENDVYIVVRNPYDKMVSNYFYSKKGIKIWKKEYSFDDFVKKVYDNDKQPLNWVTHTRMSSMDFITWEGKIINHKTIRFETLLDDFNKLKMKYDLNATLPELNKSRKDTGKYRGYYNDETISYVFQLFKDEIEYFDYKF